MHRELTHHRFAQFIVLSLVASVACRAQQLSADTARAAPSPAAKAPPTAVDAPPAAMSAAPVACVPAASLPVGVARPGALVLLGEMHGTAEVPAFVGQAACNIARTGRPVWVGLEIPRGAQVAFDTYLTSQGTAADREQLLAHPFWRRDTQDGRSSAAMADLIEHLRVLGHADLPVRTFLFDVDPTQMTTPSERDARMAAEIARIREGAGKGVVLVLVGNIHAWTRPGAPWDPSFEPMGSVLARMKAGALSLDVSLPPGTLWACMAEQGCGEHPLEHGTAGGQEGQSYGVEVFDTPTERGVHGVFRVPSATASGPAVRSMRYR